MLEEFLSQVYHPNRVVELVNTANLLYRIGLTNYTDRINQILQGEVGAEALTIAGNIETSIEAGVVAGFTQFGVDIEFDRSQIGVTTDFLQFLAFWDTYEGSSAESFPGLEDLTELGATNEDILIELFEMSGGNPDARLIDWIVSVSPSLIAKLQESFKEKPVVTDEPSTLPVSALHDFRLFAVHFPDAGVVSYVKMGGAIGISLSTLLLQNEELITTGSYKATAIELAGLALISDLPRDSLKEEFARMVEPVVGSTVSGQNVLREVNAIFSKVLK